MKKIKTFLVAMLLVIVSLAMAVACAKKDIVGVWKTAAVTIGDQTVSVGETFEGAQEPMIEDFFVLEFKEDKTVTLTTTNGDTFTVSGTWEQADGAYTLTFDVDGEETVLTVTMEGNDLICDFFGEYQIKLAKK